MLYHLTDLAMALSEVHRVLKPDGRLYAATVGRNHMQQLREVPGKLGLDMSSNPDPEVSRFNLENGVGELAPCFAEIEVERRAGALVVTEAAPLVDYIASYTRLSDDGVGKLHAYFEEEIRSKGVFRITTESGILKAIKRQ